MSILRFRRGQSTLENIIGIMIVGTAAYVFLNAMASGDDSALGSIWSTVKDTLATILDFVVPVVSGSL